MAAAEFAAVAATLLTLGLLDNDKLFGSYTLDAIKFQTAGDAILRSDWATQSGSVQLPHLKEPLRVFNALEGNPSSIPGPHTGKLHVCFAGDQIHQDTLDAWHKYFQTSFKSYEIHVVVKAASSQPTTSKGANQHDAADSRSTIRKLLSTFRPQLRHYLELEIPDLPEFGSCEECPGALITRDVCGQLIARAASLADANSHPPEMVMMIDSQLQLSTPLNVTATDTEWIISNPVHPASSLRNVVAGQPMNFFVDNVHTFVTKGKARIVGASAATIIVDGEGSWELEKLRVGHRAFAGLWGGGVRHWLSCWSALSKELLSATDSLSKAYGFYLRLLHKGLAGSKSVTVSKDAVDFVKSFDFGIDPTYLKPTTPEELFVPSLPANVNTFAPDFSSNPWMRPIADAECASYEYHVLETNVQTISTDQDGKPMRKKGTIGRVTFKILDSFDVCRNAMKGSQPLTLCQPQLQRRLKFLPLTKGGGEPGACQYCTVVPLLAQEGLCIFGGDVSITHQRTFGSFSEMGVFPKGFDGYEMFSLMEGTVEGDVGGASWMSVSAHNPKQLIDDDRPRIVPTLVPVRLKKAR